MRRLKERPYAKKLYSIYQPPSLQRFVCSKSLKTERLKLSFGEKIWCIFFAFSHRLWPCKGCAMAGYQTPQSCIVCHCHWQMNCNIIMHEDICMVACQQSSTYVNTFIYTCISIYDYVYFMRYLVEKVCAQECSGSTVECDGTLSVALHKFEEFQFDVG